MGCAARDASLFRDTYRVEHLADYRVFGGCNGGVVQSLGD